MTPAPPDAAALRALFDAPSEPTVGLEEEVMLLDGDTLDLAPRGAEVLAAAGTDQRFKPELMAAQLEIVTPPAAGVAEAVAVLAAGRRALADAADRAGGVRLACAGTHAFAATEGELTSGARYDAIAAEYGVIARRQLAFALQVHVAIRGADRALAVYNALRGYLPDLAALAANAPLHGGRDTGLASVRPTIAEQLPRQGMPPEIESWEAYAAALSGLADPATWWWELRPHIAHGTLEIRVPDAQATVAEAGAVAAVAHSLAVWLAERHDAGERLPVLATGQLDENRRSACRHGLAGEMLGEGGDREPTRERVLRLLDAVAPVGERLACGPQLSRAREIVEAGGPAQALRAEAERSGVREATAWLAGRFLDDVAG